MVSYRENPIKHKDKPKKEQECSVLLIGMNPDKWRFWNRHDRIRGNESIGNQKSTN